MSKSIQSVMIEDRIQYKPYGSVVGYVYSFGGTFVRALGAINTEEVTDLYIVWPKGYSNLATSFGVEHFEDLVIHNALK